MRNDAIFLRVPECPPNTVTPLGSDKIESIGKPSPNCEIKIFNEDDKELLAGEVGAGARGKLATAL